MANLGHDPISTTAVSALQQPLTLPVNNSGALLSAPSTKQIGYASVAVNLLTTTLFAVAMFPPGKQAYASAPPPKYQAPCEQQPRDLAIGINPNPRALQLSDSAPPPKYQVRVEQPFQIPLTLGINPNPKVLQQHASAPPPKYAIQVDPQSNLLTLHTVVVQAPFKPVDTSRLQPKFEVRADQFLNYSTLGINPNPRALQLSASAPWIKYQVQLDQPFVHPETLGINPNPAAIQQYGSAPPAKFSVQVDIPPNLLPIHSIVLTPPKVQRLDQSAPITKYAIQVDAYPDLLSNTLLYATIVPSPLIPMPNVVGLNYYMAIQTLQRAGIYLPLPAFDFAPSSISVKWAKSAYPGGIVSAQSLTAGLLVAVGQAITLTVSIYPFGSDIDSPPDWKQKT